MAHPEEGGRAAAAGPTVCYRHADRPTFAGCQRCGRTICGECQTPAAVGMHCPECTAAAQASAPRIASPMARAFRRGSSTPVVTYSIIALTLAVYVAQWVSQGAVTTALGYAPVLTLDEPWRMLTTALVHSQRSIFHLLFNMYSLFVLGPLLESFIGRARLLAVYVLSAVGGSVAVLYLAPATFVIGASGAIFGLFGAFFIVQRRLGGSSIQFIVLIGLNLGLGFIVPGISWQAHVGGLLVGVLVALVLVRTRRTGQQRAQVAALAGIAVALGVATVLRFVALL